MQINDYTIVIPILIIIYHFYRFIKMFGMYYKETKTMMRNNFQFRFLGVLLFLS